MTDIESKEMKKESPPASEKEEGVVKEAVVAVVESDSPLPTLLTSTTEDGKDNVLPENGENNVPENGGKESGKEESQSASKDPSATDQPEDENELGDTTEAVNEPPTSRRIESYEKFGYEITNKYDYAEFELAEFADGFKHFDVLDDGILTPPDIRAVMIHCGEECVDLEFSRALNKVDPEGLGLLDFQKFLDLVHQFRRLPLTECELEETFNLMDSDGSGAISAGELSHLLQCVGNALSPGDAEAMVEEADTDFSGEIEFDEFSHIILSTQ